MKERGLRETTITLLIVWIVRSAYLLIHLFGWVGKVVAKMVDNGQRMFVVKKIF